VPDFTALLNQIAARFPTRQALATALDLNASRLSRALNGTDKHTAFNVENCLRLAQVSGESASTVLRAAHKGAIADLIEALYGPEKRVSDPVVQALLRAWPTFTAAERTYVRSNVAMVLRARGTAADSASGATRFAAAAVSGSHGAAKSPVKRDGRDHAKGAAPHGHGAPLPAGATTRLRAEFEQATRDAERANGVEEPRRAARAARQSPAAARARTAGRAARPRKPRR
jgi:hypothetical protein